MVSWQKALSGWPRGRAAEAAFSGTNIMTGVQITERRPRRTGIHSLLDELANHPHKSRMGPNGAAADEVEPQIRCLQPSFFIQIVQDFHVIRDEADGNDDD